MGYERFRHPLKEHAYALYPIITIITVIIMSYRIGLRVWHQIPSPWSTVVSFGDNFSDSGNGAHITGGKYPSDPWFWHHRFSNGPNWVDNLILDLGGVGNVKMRNFAHGGASSDSAFLQGSLLGHTIPGTHQQVRGFVFKSRQTGYPNQDSTLYTMWTGANDCLALGGVEAFKPERNFTVGDIEESIFQNILQLERESHNKIRYVLILTPPPVEDMPMIRNDKPQARPAVQKAAETLTSRLPYALLERFTSIGRTVMTDSFKMAPEHPPFVLPSHRNRTVSPISYFLTVDLPQNYDHTIPHEHDGRKSNSSNAQKPPLFIHTKAAMPDGLHRPLLKLHKREDSSPSDDIPQTQHDAQTSDLKEGPGANNRLHVMVYDAYHFIKHAEENPLCFDLSPAAVNKTCGEQQSCYDRVWMDDTNINTSIHYWMARDINIRLHLWHLHTNNLSLDSVFKNSTRARELELEMLGYACPMHPAPTHF
ncbi:hypothetical protein GQ54DRAFT_328177 [Martensiomyces pterosporus]|nr:hypothetical protein GQ54DRAFT_328177 [Martensiomyces pterosporus]